MTARARSPSRFRLTCRPRPTRPRHRQCCGRWATASPPASDPCRQRPATPSGSCSARHGQGQARGAPGPACREGSLMEPQTRHDPVGRSLADRSGSPRVRPWRPNPAHDRPMPCCELVPPDVAVVVTVEGLRDQALAFSKSRLAADLRRLPAVQSLARLGKAQAVRTVARHDRDNPGGQPDRAARRAPGRRGGPGSATPTPTGPRRRRPAGSSCSRRATGCSCSG